MDKFLVTLLGILGIGGIYWFFFGNRSAESGYGSAKEKWDILVDGGYKPNTIVVPANKKSTITLTRTDPNSCLEEILVSDFKIKRFLPLNTPVTITLSPVKAGTYDMHCGMSMFHGKIIVI